MYKNAIKNIILWLDSRDQIFGKVFYSSCLKIFENLDGTEAERAQTCLGPQNHLNGNVFHKTLQMTHKTCWFWLVIE